MKIIYHHRTLGDGAEGIHIDEMVNAFKKLGNQVVLCGPSTGKGRGAGRRFSLVKTMINGPFYELMEFTYNFIGFLSLIKIIKESSPDFIYDRYMIFNLSSVLAGKLFKIPVITEINAPLTYERKNEPDEKLYFYKLAGVIEKWVAKKSTKTIVVSTPLKNYFVQQGVIKEQFVILPNGVNHSKFVEYAGFSNFRQAFGIKSTDQVVGFTGILRPWHGLDLLVHAFYKLRQTLPNVKLVLVGDGPEQETIEKTIGAYGLAESVYITGRVTHSDIPKYINGFDIAVSPKTTFYASPMKIPEYMALEKCVIAPDTPNIRDLVEDGKTALLFKPEDAQALFEKMKLALTDYCLRHTIAKNASDKVIKSMRWTDNAKQVLDLLN